MDRKNYQAVFCAFESPSMVEIDKKTLTSDKGAKKLLFTGPYAAGYNQMSDTAFGKEKYNYTTFIEQSYGILNETTGYYEDGCMRALQEGRADTAALYTSFPVVQPGLSQQQAITEDKIVIFSHYTVRDQGKLIDLLTGLLMAFDFKLWMLILANIFAFWLLIKWHIRNEKTRKKKTQGQNILYQVLTHIFQVESIDYESTVLRFVSVLMTFLSFFTLVYLCNLLNTSLVVRDKLDIIESYDDLLNVPILRTYFFPLQNTYKDFEFAKPGTKEQKVWQKGLQHYKREQLLINFNFALTVYDLMDELTKGHKDRKSVAILSGIIAPIARQFVCGIKARAFPQETNAYENIGMKNQLNTYSYLSHDPESKTRLVGLVFSSNFTTPLAKRIAKRAQSIFEFGVYQMVFRLLDVPFSSHSDFNQFQHQVFKKCLRSRYQDNIDDGELQAVKLVQFEMPLVVCGALFALSFYVLVGEEMKKKTKRVTVNLP